MNYENLNIVVWMGAIQGFTLCVYLFTKREGNRKAFNFFLLFLFAFSFFNFLYALLIEQVDRIAFIPLTSFPLPYKYLFGVGFYGYILSHLGRLKKEFFVKRGIALLFIPAIIYGAVRTYWYVVLHSGIDPDIFWNVYQTGFFTYNEFAYLVFNLVLSLLSLQIVQASRSKIESTKRNVKNWKLLQTLCFGFLGFTALKLLLVTLGVFLELQDSGHHYFLILICNSAFIYWVGYIGFSKSQHLFNVIKLKREGEMKQEEIGLKAQLERLIQEEEVFTNPNLKVADLAAILDATPKDLSAIINEHYQMGFSKFINTHRVEKVKVLLLSPDEEKYTLLNLAERSGFSSKSSFNATFKDFTGLTPKEFKTVNKA